MLLLSADINTSAPGARNGIDPTSISALLKWISDTQSKLPDGSSFSIDSKLREDSYNADPLLNQMVEYKKNTLLASGHLNTNDNKKFEEAIKEIEAYHNTLNTIERLRDVHPDYTCRHGKAFLQCWPSFDKLESLTTIDNKTIRVYEDQFDSKKKAYHQRIEINANWNTDDKTEEYNTWWIPDIPSGSLWYESGDMKDPATKAAFDKLAKDYGIKDIKNLKIGSSLDIIPLVKSKAPIDSCVLAIWLKRLMLVQSPNIIYRVLSPILQMMVGQPIETIINGERFLTPTAPPMPDSNLQSTNPEVYQQQVKVYEEFKASINTAIENISAAIKNGGTFATAPGIDVKVLESAQSITSNFILEMVGIFNKEIAQAVGFPIALIDASGSELATSRVVKDTLNTALQGEKQEFEYVFNYINNKVFAGRKWPYEIELKDGSVERGSYSYEDINARWCLDLPDNNDQKTDAETLKLLVEAIVMIKTSLGAGKSDIQALIDENTELGILDLDHFDDAMQVAPNEPTTATSASVEDDLKDSLYKAYLEGKKNFSMLLGELQGE